MGALEPAGEQIVGFVAEHQVVFRFRLFCWELQVPFPVKAKRDPVGAFGWF